MRGPQSGDFIYRMAGVMKKRVTHGVDFTLGYLNGTN